MKITRFEDIEAWKASRKLMNRVYELTKSPAFGADPDLRRQIRRSSVSALSNVAEGFDAGSDAEFRRFLRIARRSVTETQSHLYVALDLGYMDQKNFQQLYDQAVEVKKLMGGFLRYLRGDSKS